jgi:hypothetical protein
MESTRKESMNNSNPMEAGPQPLAELMAQHGLKPHDLVAASSEHLNHKQVSKGCKGRRLTTRMQDKLMRALNACTGEQYRRTDLFNYRGQ